MNQRNQIIETLIITVENELKNRSDVYKCSDDPLKDYQMMVFFMQQIEELKQTNTIEIQEPAIYSFPESQQCMECDHSKFIMSDELTNSDYLCLINCHENDGCCCPKQALKEEV